MVRNQSVWIRSRGRLIEDRNRETKNSGNIVCTASPEPVRSATNAPSDPNPTDITIDRARMVSAPPGPAAKPAPAATPTSRNVTACTTPSARAPPSIPASSAGAASGVSARRLKKPDSTSLARSVPAFMAANSAPCMNGTASANVR